MTMEIAIGLLGMGDLSLLISFVYILISSRKLQKYMMDALARIEEGLKDIAQARNDVAQMLLSQTKILERIEVRLQ